MEKICFKCRQSKELSEYYEHPQMADGHLNKCKDCTKKDTADRYNNLIKTDPEFVVSERERSREKQNRLPYYKGRKYSAQANSKRGKNYVSKFPEKVAIHKKCHSLRASIAGNEIHHWSYNPEHAFDVIELSVRDHKKLHRFLIYDQSTKMYRTKTEGVLLTSKIMHYNFFLSIRNIPDWKGQNQSLKI